jgi:ATP-binding cassette subfamily G (WHITE) protein 2 (SNQ2)
MLDVIGAGATASSTQDWHNIWRDSQAFRETQEEIDAIHPRECDRPEGTRHSEFPTSWPSQTIQLFKRDTLSRWRNPTYLVAKLTLNILGGLFIGVSYM